MARKPSIAEVSLRVDYLDYVENMEARAEVATNGVLWSRRGRATVGIRQWDLFTRQWAHMVPYASEELLAWFECHGRMTFTEYREQIRTFNREAYADYLDSLEVC